MTDFSSERKTPANKMTRADKIAEMRRAVASVSEEDKKMFDAVSGAIIVLQHFVLSVIFKYAMLALTIRKLEKKVKALEEEKRAGNNFCYETNNLLDTRQEKV